MSQHIETVRSSYEGDNVLFLILLFGGLAVFFTAFFIKKANTRNIIGSAGFLMMLIASVMGVIQVSNWVNSTQSTENYSELKTLVEKEYDLNLNSSEKELYRLINFEEVTAETSTGDVIQIRIDEYEGIYYLFSDGTQLEPVT